MHDWKAKHLFMVLSNCNHDKETKETKFGSDLQTAAFSLINKGHSH